MSKKVKEKDKKQDVQKVEPTHALNPFEEMERQFDNFLSKRWMSPFFMDWPSFHKMSSFDGKSPSVDIIERDNEVIVKAELPGVNKKDIDISVTENKVTIKGTTSHEEKEEKGDYYRSELSRGSYARTLSLPAEVDEENTRATFKDGILELTLPKLKKSKRHTITVE